MHEQESKNLIQEIQAGANTNPGRAGQKHRYRDPTQRGEEFQRREVKSTQQRQPLTQEKMADVERSDFRIDEQVEEGERRTGQGAEGPDAQQATQELSTEQNETGAEEEQHVEQGKKHHFQGPVS